MTKLEKAREIFAKDKYATDATGIVIEEIGENYAKCRLELADIHKNAVGHVMGGVMFTLADFVFAVSTNFEGPMTVSAVAQISYLNSPKGDVLFGESKLIKDGKRVCFYEVNITDDKGTDVAVVSFTGSHIGIKE